MKNVDSEVIQSQQVFNNLTVNNFNILLIVTKKTEVLNLSFFNPVFLQGLAFVNAHLCILIHSLLDQFLW